MKEEEFTRSFAPLLLMLESFCADDDMHDLVIVALTEALDCVPQTHDWSASGVYPSFEKYATDLAPKFRAVPVDVRREVPYILLCAYGSHGEAWQYREGVRETYGPDATEGWRPGWYDLQNQHFGRSVVSAAVVSRVLPRTLQQMIDRGHSVHGVDSAGRTALHHAALLKFKKHESDYSQQLLDVLIAAGIAVDARDAAGLTALDVAIAEKRGGLIATLVLAGAVPTTAKRLKSVRRNAEKFGWREELSQREAHWVGARRVSLSDRSLGRRVRM